MKLSIRIVAMALLVTAFWPVSPEHLLFSYARIVGCLIAIIVTLSILELAERK